MKTEQEKKISRDFDSAVGARIRTYRIVAGLSQSDLGKAISVSFQQIQKIERGINRLSCEQLIGLSNVLGIHPMRLLSEDAIEPILWVRADLELAKRMSRLTTDQKQAVRVLLDVFLPEGE